MTPAQLNIFRHRLATNRQPIIKGEQYAHPRGWNDALDFVETVLKEVMGKEVNSESDAT